MENTAMQILFLHEMSGDKLNKYLSFFIKEVNRQDGKPYPPRSLYSIVSGILRLLREDRVNDKNFLDQKDGRFAYFRKTFDAKMKQLTKEGVGVQKKQAQYLTQEHENELWIKGEFGNSSAQSLLNTVYFYNCKIFGLRGADEHRHLECN